LDETFDVGEDTGTPAEFNLHNVPFKFTGHINKISVDLKPSNLTASDQKKVAEGELIAELTNQ
jgi:hypothetical protein